MGVATNSKQDANARLVEKYLNTAYDNVKVVADNIDAVTANVENIDKFTSVYDDLANIVAVGSNIESVTTVASNVDLMNTNADNLDKFTAIYNDLMSITTTSTNIDDIKIVSLNLAVLQYIAEQIEDFKGLYYGPLATIPTTRPNGDLSVEGDMYFNTVTNVIFIRVDEEWNSITANLVFNESTIISAANIIGSDTVVDTVSTYSVGLNSLLVFVNNVYQPNKAVSVNGTYVETDSNTITFPNLTLEDGDEVYIVIGSVISTVNPTIKVTTLRYVTVDTNESAITLPNNEVYVADDNSLEVFLNGVLKFPGVHYIETNSTTITFVSVLPTIGTEVIFRKGSFVNTATRETIGEGDLIEFKLATAFFANKGVTDTSKSVYLSSYASANDNRSGMYVYNVIGARTSADGIAIIDETVSLAAQGSGVGQGVWVLQMGLVAERMDEYLGAIYDTL
jgi:hypothetical protein